MLRLLFVLAVTSLALAAPHEELVEKRGLPKYHVVLGPMTWFEARDACKAVPTCKLAEPKSLAQMNEIMNVFVPGFNWIGITDLLVSDTFAYDSSNSPIVYENWDANEPNNENGTEDCTEIWKFDGTWNDVNCSLARGNAICECPTNGPIGDPHMRTFDGRAYTFQGIGWYYLFKDCTENPRFEVTTKFERREDSTPDQIKTRTIAINITVGNQYAIIDGLDVTTGSTGGMVTDAKRITIQEEEKNIKLHFTSKDTTFTFNWTLRKHELDVSYSGSFYNGKLCGLMGNADGDTRNDFQKPDGSISKDVLEFSESWKVTGKK